MNKTNKMWVSKIKHLSKKKTQQQQNYIFPYLGRLDRHKKLTLLKWLWMVFFLFHQGL